ncbi:MAG: hypothetical protein LBC79_01700, partial [Deltaproteobacteria bacterium]|nr:hypothetical protein [Deltaproteobacteria bacterium]
WPFTRADTLALLNAENMHARAWYAGLQHIACHKQTGEAVPRLPVSEWAATRHIIMPFGSTMSVADTETAGELLHDLYAMRDELQSALSGGSVYEA